MNEDLGVAFVVKIVRKVAKTGLRNIAVFWIDNARLSLADCSETFPSLQRSVRICR